VQHAVGQSPGKRDDDRQVLAGEPLAANPRWLKASMQLLFYSEVAGDDVAHQ